MYLFLFRVGLTRSRARAEAGHMMPVNGRLVADEVGFVTIPRTTCIIRCCSMNEWLPKRPTSTD